MTRWLSLISARRWIGNNNLASSGWPLETPLPASSIRWRMDVGSRITYSGSGLGIESIATSFCGPGAGRPFPSFSPSRTAQPLELDAYHDLDDIPHAATTLVPPFSLEEVQDAVWSLNGEGAPGTDEIPIFFYKKC